jgi:hypothetical protein
MMTTVSQKVTNHNQRMAFGCEYCDKTMKILTDNGADHKKAARYLQLFLPKENMNSKYKTARCQHTKHQLAVLRLYEQIATFKLPMNQNLANLLEMVSHMKA